MYIATFSDQYCEQKHANNDSPNLNASYSGINSSRLLKLIPNNQFQKWLWINSNVESVQNKSRIICSFWNSELIQLSLIFIIDVYRTDTHKPLYIILHFTHAHHMIHSSILVGRLCERVTQFWLTTIMTTVAMAT